MNKKFRSETNWYSSLYISCNHKNAIAPMSTYIDLLTIKHL